MQQSSGSTTWRDTFLWAAMLITGIGLIALCFARYAGYNSGMLDLGAMSQAIFSVLRGAPLETTGANGQFSRLSGHVELIYFAVVPFAWIWRDPRVLLVVQILVYVAGAIPAYRMALRRLEHRTAARCVALMYLIYPVALTAVLFDFHGDTLAMPILLFALDAADRRDWRSFALWAGLALLCKLYIALSVAGIAAYLFLWGGQRKAGLITGVVAVAYGALCFFVIRELFAPANVAGSVAQVYTNHYFGNLGELTSTLGQRLLNAFVVFGPALLISWRGWRWLLVGAPIALAALISTGPGGVYDFRYHHYATIVPFIIMAVVDGASRLKEQATNTAAGQPKRPRRSWRNDLVFTTLIVCLISALLVDIPLNPLFWLGLPERGIDHSAYGVTSRDAMKDGFLADTIKEDIPVATSSFLATRLTDRRYLYLVRYNDDPGGERLPTILPLVDQVVADALFDWRTIINEQLLGGINYEQAEIALLLNDPAFGLTAARDGLLLFERDARPDQILEQSIAPIETMDLPEQPLGFGPIRLLGVSIEPINERRFLARFAWHLSSNIQLPGNYVAISRLDGVADARIVHLPSYILQPTSSWSPDETMLEQFAFELPADLAPGSYRMLTSWYNPQSPNAYLSNASSLIPGSTEQFVTTIEVGQ